MSRTASLPRRVAAAWRPAALAFALCGSLAACPSPPLIGVPLPQPEDSVRYDQSIEPACHNCYERQHLDSIAAAFPLVRNLEFDIYARPGGGGRPSALRTWSVRHHKNDPDTLNNCPRENGHGNLRTCLRAVASWLGRNERGLPVTVFLDLKDLNWPSGRKPLDLDTLLRSTFGQRLYTPRDLLGRRGGTLRAAVEARAWPRLGEMRGRVLVVLTGGDDPGRTLVDANQTLVAYLKSRDTAAVAFVAPGVVSEIEVRELPMGIDSASATEVVFYNYAGSLLKIGGFQLSNPDSERRVGRAIRARGGVGRIWWRADSKPPSAYPCRAAHAGFQRPALFAIKDHHRLCPGEIPARRPTPASRAPTGAPPTEPARG